MPVNQSVPFRTERYFIPSEGQEIICITNYTHDNQPAMIAAEFGEGNLFISSPHFEYEENGDRDGTEYMSGYDDPDSEWPMLLTISRWLVDSSPTVANISSWPYEPTSPYQLPMDLIIVSGGIGVVLILGVVILKRR